MRGAGLFLLPFLRRRCPFFLGVLDLERLPLFGVFDLGFELDLDLGLLPFFFSFLLLFRLRPRSEDFGLPLPCEPLRPRLLERPPPLPFWSPLPVCAGAEGGIS